MGVNFKMLFKRRDSLKFDKRHIYAPCTALLEHTTCSYEVTIYFQNKKKLFFFLELGLNIDQN